MGGKREGDKGMTLNIDRVRHGSGTGFDGFGDCPRSCDRNKKKFKSIHEELTELCPVQVSGQ
jgi:hypothetical protein